MLLYYLVLFWYVIKENINEVISNKQLDFLKNINGGIFIINKNEIPKEDLEAMEFKANIIINSSMGRNFNSYKRIWRKRKFTW